MSSGTGKIYKRKALRDGGRIARDGQMLHGVYIRMLCISNYHSPKIEHGILLFNHMSLS
jgi:hypothetical protein